MLRLTPILQQKLMLIQKPIHYFLISWVAINVNAETTILRNASQLPKKLVKHSIKMSAIPLTRKNVHLKRKLHAKLFINKRFHTRKNKNVRRTIEKNASQITIMAKNVPKYQKNRVSM